MGCDIHLHIEIKIAGQWHHYACPKIDRNYELFSIMADVRGNLPAISEPKGLPEDASIITKMNYDEYWSGDAHSKSYLNSDELVILSASITDHLGLDLEHDILRCYLFGNSFDGFILYPKSYPKEIEDVRFVFWFDN